MNKTDLEDAQSPLKKVEQQNRGTKKPENKHPKREGRQLHLFCIISSLPLLPTTPKLALFSVGKEHPNYKELTS